MNIDLQNSLDIKKIAKYYRVDRDEVINEAWILMQVEPDLEKKEFFEKLRSVFIEANKTNGLMGIEMCAVDADEAMGEDVVEKAHQSFGKNPETYFVELEEAREREQKIANLSDKKKLRLKALEDCTSAIEFSKTIGMSKRYGQKQVASWIAEETAPQMSMFEESETA